MHSQRVIPVLLVAVVLLTIVGFTLLFSGTRIPSVSAVETASSIGVYWDASCQDRVDWLDWGNIFPGAILNLDVYIRNEGNESMILDIISENWSPVIAAQYISLSWDYDGYTIYKNQVKAIELALSISPEIKGVTSFSFDIGIYEVAGDALSLGEVAGDKILNAPANTVYFIYADPSYMTRAEATYDIVSGEVVRNHCENIQYYGYNTTQYWLLPSGAINTTTIHNKTIAMFGGRCPNVAMEYYENVRGLTPVKFKGNNTLSWFENRAGATLGTLSPSVIEAPNYHEDMFTVMVFYDEEGDNTFFVIYGIDWKGTWAGGIYFTEVMSKNLSAYTNDYYLFHWIDDNQQNGIPQSHEIIQIVAAP